MIELIGEGEVLLAGRCRSPLHSVLPCFTCFIRFGDHGIGAGGGQGHDKQGVGATCPIIILGNRLPLWVTQHQIGVEVIATQFDREGFSSDALEGVGGIVAAIGFKDSGVLV